MTYTVFLFHNISVYNDYEQLQSGIYKLINNDNQNVVNNQK